MKYQILDGLTKAALKNTNDKIDNLFNNKKEEIKKEKRKVKEGELSKNVIKKVDEKVKSEGFDPNKCETYIEYDPNTNLYCKSYSCDVPIEGMEGKVIHSFCHIYFDEYGLHIKGPAVSKGFIRPKLKKI